MGDDVRHVIDEALKLPVADRAAVVTELLASIDGAPDGDAEAAWAAEIERRADRALRGETHGKDWPTVLRELEARRRR